MISNSRMVKKTTQHEQTHFSYFLLIKNQENNVAETCLEDTTPTENQTEHTLNHTLHSTQKQHSAMDLQKIEHTF